MIYENSNTNESVSGGETYSKNVDLKVAINKKNKKREDSLSGNFLHYYSKEMLSPEQVQQTQTQKINSRHIDSQPSLASIDKSNHKMSRSMKRTQTPLERADNIYNTTEADTDFMHRVTSHNR